MKPFVPALARSAPAPATGLAAASSAGSSGGAESDFLSANTPSKRTIKHSKDQPNEPLQEQMHECKKKQMKQTKHRCQQLCNTRQNLMVTLVQSQLRGMLVYCGEHSVSQCLVFHDHGGKSSSQTLNRFQCYHCQSKVFTTENKRKATRQLPAASMKDRFHFDRLQRIYEDH